MIIAFIAKPKKLYHHQIKIRLSTESYNTRYKKRKDGTKKTNNNKKRLKALFFIIQMEPENWHSYFSRIHTYVWRYLSKTKNGRNSKKKFACVIFCSVMPRKAVERKKKLYQYAGRTR